MLRGSATWNGSELWEAAEVRALEDTVPAFREYQRDYIVRDDDRGQLRGHRAAALARAGPVLGR